MITPTVGRVVWFYPNAPIGTRPPYAALVVYVWTDRMVNLAYFDQNGVPLAATSVILLQEDDPIPQIGSYCAWMPYQKGQAAKTEAVEASAGQGAGTDYNRQNALVAAIDYARYISGIDAPDEIVKNAETFHVFLSKKAA